MLGEIAAGRDPADERDKTRAGKSLAVVLEQFMTEHVRPKLKARTASEYQRTARLHILPRLGRRPIGELKRQDIAELHHELAISPIRLIGRWHCSVSFSDGQRSTGCGQTAPIPAGTLRSTVRDGASGF